MTHKHGIDLKDAQSLKSNMAVVKSRKDEMVRTLNGFLGLFEQFKTELVRGEGRFVGPKVVQVSDGRLLTADNIVICTGSRAFVDAGIPGLVESMPMTHIEMLDLDVLPSHLIIIGGGYVGVEFAQAYRRFGAEVTVIQRQEQILPQEDEDVVACLVGILEKEGIRFLVNTAVESVSGLSGQSVKLNLKSTNGAVLTETSVQGSHILVAAGQLSKTWTWIKRVSKRQPQDMSLWMSSSEQLSQVYMLQEIAQAAHILPIWATMTFGSFLVISLAHPARKVLWDDTYRVSCSQHRSWRKLG